jgi:hypothetical protein
LTADRAGGVEHVNFDIYDYAHSGHGWTNCDRDDAACYGDNH